jgi:hypothetical protein
VRNERRVGRPVPAEMAPRKRAPLIERKLAAENVRRLTLKDLTAGQLWRDAKLYEFDAGASKIHRMLTGRELMAETN